MHEHDLRFFAELDARMVPWFLGGRAAAHLQGIGTYTTADVHVARDDAPVREAMKAAGVSRAAYEPGEPRVTLQVGRVEGIESFDEEYRHAIRLHTDGIMLRAMPLVRILSRMRAMSYGDYGERAWLQREMVARGLSIDDGLDRSPTLRRWSDIVGSAESRRIEELLQDARYVRADDGRAGSYSILLHDVEPRHGVSEHSIDVVEDPARPVIDRIAAMRRGLGTTC